MKTKSSSLRSEVLELLGVRQMLNAHPVTILELTGSLNEAGCATTTDVVQEVLTALLHQGLVTIEHGSNGWLITETGIAVPTIA